MQEVYFCNYAQTIDKLQVSARTKLVANLAERYTGLLTALARDEEVNNKLPEIHKKITAHVQDEQAKKTLSTAYTSHMKTQSKSMAPGPQSQDDARQREREEQRKQEERERKEREHNDKIQYMCVSAAQNLTMLSLTKGLEKRIGTRCTQELHNKMKDIRDMAYSQPWDSNNSVINFTNTVEDLQEWCKTQEKTSNLPVWSKIGTIVSSTIKAVTLSISLISPGSKEGSAKREADKAELKHYKAELKHYMEHLKKDLSGKSSRAAASINNIGNNAQSFVEQINKERETGRSNFQHR